MVLRGSSCGAPLQTDQGRLGWGAATAAGGKRGVRCRDSAARGRDDWLRRVRVACALRPAREVQPLSDRHGWRQIDRAMQRKAKHSKAQQSTARRDRPLQSALRCGAAQHTHHAPRSTEASTHHLCAPRVGTVLTCVYTDTQTHRLPTADALETSTCITPIVRLTMSRVLCCQGRMGRIEHVVAGQQHM
jgi:hypothetical protein